MESKKHYTGLTDAQVIESRRKHGANILTPPKRESLWQIFIDNFKDPVIRILLIAVFLSGGIAIAMYLSEDVIEIAETIGIAAAVLLATGVATWFVWDANKKFDVLNQINDDTLVKVFRNKNVREVPKKEIVVGDIVILEQGEEIPADGILLEAVSLQVNESSLTGEPMTAKSVIEEEFDREATYPTDHVMRGTTVADGHGVMEVTAVGDQTEFGKVAEKSTEKMRRTDSFGQTIRGTGKIYRYRRFLRCNRDLYDSFHKRAFFQPGVSYPFFRTTGTDRSCHYYGCHHVG